MLNRRLIVSAALLSSLLWIVPDAPAQEGGLEEFEIKKLAVALNEALETYEGATIKKSTRAREKLDSELISIGKRRKAPKGEEIQAALAHSADLGTALFRATKLRATAKGKVQSFELDDTDISYSVHAPAKYDPRSKTYPVCVIIPGLDDSKVMKSETMLQEYWTDGDLRDEVILVAIDMPEEVASWTERSTTDGKPGGIMTVMLSLAEVRRTFACDFDRFFLAGHGIGVPAAAHLGNLFPHLFAGVIGRAGDVGELECGNFRNLPTFFAGGGALTTAFEEKIKQVGYDNCSVAANATDAEILSWIRANPRNSHPTHVTLVPGSPIPNAAYWIKVPATDTGGEARIEAQADRESNTITVEGSGVASVTILFNDQLIDMSKPITIVVNGVSQENVIPRNLDTVLEYIYRGKSDPGRMYTAVKTYDLPAEQ